MGLFGFGSAMLQRWVQAQELILLSAESCWFFKGPYFFTTRGQEVYRITVRDAAGATGTGYARCGGYWLGTLTDQVEVTWDGAGNRSPWAAGPSVFTAATLHAPSFPAFSSRPATV